MASISFDDHFKDLFDNINDLIHFLKIDGTIELVNPAWLNTLGYTLDEVTGKSIFSFIHPDHIDDYKLIRDRTMLYQKSNEIKTIFLAKDGSHVFLQGQLGCSIKNGIPVYTRSVLRNDSEKRKAEKLVQDRDRRINTLFKSGPDAIIIINEKQEILEWNPKAEQIFGYDAEEIKGKLISEIIIPVQYREAHKKGMAHFMKTGEGPVLNTTIEITALHKTGKEFFINLSISSVKVGEGWLFIAFLSDITKRKQTEEALMKKETELLKSKILEEKRDEFVSIASHELKTPLTTIKAYTQLALVHLSSNKIEKVKDFLIKSDSHIAKLNRLISELLDVSKIHAGKLALNLEEIKLETFLRSVADNIQPTLYDHEIILKKNEPALIKGDVMRLEQVIINLFTNAAKYSPGENKIILNSDLDGNEVIISIQDFGIGIPEGHLEKIFTRFYRVDEIGTNFNGLGIGLYISAEIIKQHNGRIWVKSVPGEGSIFFLALPLI